MLCLRMFVPANDRVQVSHTLTDSINGGRGANDDGKHCNGVATIYEVGERGMMEWGSVHVTTDVSSGFAVVGKG